jgi:hypothetical protein
MAQLRSLAERFEDLCAELLAELAHEIAREVEITPPFRVDIVARKRRKIEFAVDVKLVAESPAPCPN